MRAWIVCFALFSFGCAAHRSVPTATSTTEGQSEHVLIDAGRLRLDVSFARTAHVFHVVDQLSAWSEYTHRQYDPWANAWPLDDVDREMLEVHAVMRRARGWGHGFEKAFYVDAPIDRAATNATIGKLLSPEESAIEAVVLRRFEARVMANVAPGISQVRAFATRLASDTTKLRSIAARLARFVKLEAPFLDIATYFIVDPDDTMSGGGMNGERLVVEVPAQRDVTDVVVHEALHVFLETRKADLERAIEDAPGLSLETLNEGIAYALAPGLVHPRDGDPLAEEVARDRARGTSIADAYPRFRRYALALRPHLAKALADGTTIDGFLPLAVSVYMKDVSPEGR